MISIALDVLRNSVHVATASTGYLCRDIDDGCGMRGACLGGTKPHVAIFD